MDWKLDRATHSPAAGFTLIEAVISMVVVAVMLMAALNTLGGAAKNRLVQSSLQQGPALASQLMAEVLQAAYEEETDTPIFGKETGETGGTRENFDDIDDYHNWQPATIQDQTGVAIANTTGWTRQVTVERVTVADPSTTSGSDTGLKRVTVTVTDPHNRTTTLVALRSRYGAYDQTPDTDTTILTAVEVQLQVGADADATITSGTGLYNWPTPPASEVGDSFLTTPFDYYPTDPYVPVPTE